MFHAELCPETVDPRELETALNSKHSEAILHGLLTGDWSLVDSLPEPEGDGLSCVDGALVAA
jgi:hypothetical protein